MEPYVHTQIDQHIATVEFFHPRSNALPSDLLRQLADQITAAGQHPDAHVIVLRSGGDRTFCAGASFDELLTIQDETAGRAFFMGFANVINACRQVPKLVIGRVQGKAIGGGVGLAAATDLCYASRFADSKLSELSIGIGPFVIGPAVERRIGKAAFAELSIQATDFKPAQWAHEKGLYAKVFDSTDALDEAVATLAQQLAASSPEAMQGLKRVLWEGTDHWDTLLAARAALSGRLVLSDFAKSFLAAQRPAN